MALKAGRYNLTKTQIKALCSNYLGSLDHKPSTRFGCYLFEGTDDFSDLARYVETEVFDETFKNNHRVMLKEYGPYDISSLFFVVIDHVTSMPIGAMRVILPGKAGLKTLVDLTNTPLKLQPNHFFEAYNILPSQCVDLATIAVARDYRGRTYKYLPSLLLYRSLYVRVLKDRKYKRVVSIIDQRPFEMLLKLGMPFETILKSKPFSYLNSGVSFAVQAKTDNFLSSVSTQASRYGRSLRPTNQYMRRLMRRLISGRGLDSMIDFLPRNS
jgi:hypothetical protein